nr:hypothetical protein [Roseobacter litoralis]
MSTGLRSSPATIEQAAAFADRFAFKSGHAGLWGGRPKHVKPQPPTARQSRIAPMILRAPVKRHAPWVCSSAAKVPICAPKRYRRLPR